MSKRTFSGNTLDELQDIKKQIDDFVRTYFTEHKEEAAEQLRASAKKLRAESIIP